MVVCSSVGSADDHDGVAGCGRGGGVVDAVVVDGWLEKVGVGLEPGIGIVSIWRRRGGWRVSLL